MVAIVSRRGAAPFRRCTAEPRDPVSYVSSASRRKEAARRAASGARRRALPALLRPHQIGEPLEQIMRVARAGRGFGGILHREYRLAVQLGAPIGAGEKR